MNDVKEKLPFANKSLGQHFLRDKQVIQKITSDFESEAEAIIEVGPGPGILTEFLAQKNLPFTVIEKDERFPELLEKFLPREQILLTDALEVNLQELIKEKGWENKKIWLVSNLPYNVSTPLLIKFIQVPEIKMMSLMFQREVADKVFAFDTKPEKAMNSLMALSQTYFNISLLCKVKPGAFNPPPKVDSAVLSFKRIEDPVVPLQNWKKLESFLRTVFQFKRKQLGKVLKGYSTEEKIQIALSHIGKEKNIRAEAITLTDIQNLFIKLTSLQD